MRITPRQRCKLRPMPGSYLFETDEHAELRAQVRRFARDHIAPHAHAWDEAEEFPRALYQAAM